ncbi:MAG: NRDE family protein, partial [Rhodothermales bacterium]
MCLILFAYRQHASYRLILAANRDEFYGRPTALAAFWEETPDLLAGRDLKSGGTWLGVTRAGRFAAITNYREPDVHLEHAPSRGELVAGFLQSDNAPQAYLDHLAPSADRYNGFNLIVGDAEAMGYFSNREGTVRMLGPGVYGLSNHLLDTPWPKVEQGKKLLEEYLGHDEIDAEALLVALNNPTEAPDERLPDTGVGLAWERVLSPLFIQSPDYGTRASTVLLISHNGEVTFA